VWLRPVATPGPPLRDFEAYYAAGATWRAGDDAYGRAIWRVERHLPGVDAARDELLPFVGPPFSLPLWGLFAALPFSLAVVVWGVVLALSAGGLAFGSLRLAGARDPASFAAVALLAIAFGPVTSAFALGQVALVSCAGVVLATLALSIERARSAIAAALCAALQPNLGAVLVARLSDGRAWFSLSVAAAVALAGSLAATGGVAGFVRYIWLLGRHAGAERTIAIQTTFTAVAFGLGASEDAARIAGVAIAVAVIGITAWILLGRAYAPEARVAVACAALPLVLPFSHEHDLAVAFFPALLCVRRARRALWVVAASATVAIAADWLGLAQRPSGLAQSVALALAAALAVVALARDRLGASAIAPFAVVACVALAGIFAAQHPLPIWPDALSPHFHAPPNLDATEVWRLEQTSSGLADRNPTSALLRLCSLAGCAGLWLTSLVALRVSLGGRTPG
jgi:hypothetical protein